APRLAPAPAGPPGERQRAKNESPRLATGSSRGRCGVAARSTSVAGEQSKREPPPCQGSHLPSMRGRLVSRPRKRGAGRPAGRRRKTQGPRELAAPGVPTTRAARGFRFVGWHREVNET